jgi:hypothetical protein
MNNITDKIRIIIIFLPLFMVLIKTIKNENFFILKNENYY